MNKTISLLFYNRPDYSKQVLEALSNTKGIEEWQVNVYCDNPGHAKLAELAKSFDIVDNVALAPKRFHHVGRESQKRAARWAIGSNFVKYKSDFNVHVEDDILLGPDALAFMEACYPYIKGDVGSVSLKGYFDDIDPTPEQQKSVFKEVWHDPGWGWATTREFYFNHFIKAKDQKLPNGMTTSWAEAVLLYYKEHGFHQLRQYVRRSKNIGRFGATHPSGGKLNCFDVGNDWTGGNLDPVWEWEFEYER